MTLTKHNYLQAIIDSESAAEDYCLSSNFDERYADIYPNLSKKMLWKLSSEYDKTNYSSLKRVLCSNFKLKYLALGTGTEELILRWSGIVRNKKQKVGIVLPAFYRVLDSLSDYGFIKVDSLFDSKLKELDVLFLSNPNPLTGQIFSREELLDIIGNYPKLNFFIDEASMLLTKNNIKYSMISDAGKYKNTSVLFSLSKLYGLSGERIGIICGNKKTVNEFENSGPVFPISSSSAYIAENVVQNEKFFKKILFDIEKYKQEVEKLLKETPDIEVSPSAANCIYFRNTKSDDLFEQLLKFGIASLNLDTQEGNRITGGVRITIHSSPVKHEYLLSKLKLWQTAKK